MILKLNNRESNSLARWGVGYDLADQVKYAEYPCYIFNRNEVSSIDFAISKFACCSIFNVSHTPEKASRLGLLKWQKKWDKRWLGKKSESVFIDAGATGVYVNILRLGKVGALELFDVFGGATTFVILHRDGDVGDVLNSLSKSLKIKVFASVDYPKLLSELSGDERFLVRKYNFPEESLILISF